MRPNDLSQALSQLFLGLGRLGALDLLPSDYREYSSYLDPGLHNLTFHNGTIEIFPTTQSLSLALKNINLSYHLPAGSGLPSSDAHGTLDAAINLFGKPGEAQKGIYTNASIDGSLFGEANVIGKQYSGNKSLDSQQLDAAISLNGIFDIQDLRRWRISLSSIDASYDIGDARATLAIAGSIMIDPGTIRTDVKSIVLNYDTPTDGTWNADIRFGAANTFSAVVRKNNQLLGRLNIDSDTNLRIEISPELVSNLSISEQTANNLFDGQEISIGDKTLSEITASLGRKNNNLTPSLSFLLDKEQSRRTYDVETITASLSGVKSADLRLFSASPDPVISLSSTSFDENVTAGSAVSILSTTGYAEGGALNYSLTAGSGDTDNALFSINGSVLSILQSPNYETKSAYSIRVRSSDSTGVVADKSVTLSVNNINEAPTSIQLSSTKLDENIPAGSFVATLTSIDPDSDDRFSYSLTKGNGSNDNSAFKIIGDKLQILRSPDFEKKSSYSVRISSTDSGRLVREDTFKINVVNLPDNITGYRSIKGASGGPIQLQNSRDALLYFSDSWPLVQPDVVSGFQPRSDKIFIESTASNRINNSRLYVVPSLVITGKPKIDAKAEKAYQANAARIGLTGASFIYTQSTGALIYDQNGSAQGFGTGGIMATFPEKPLLTGSNLALF